MKTGVNLILGLFLMLLLASGLRYVFRVVRHAVAGEGIRGMVLWQYDWNEALAEAAERHKPLLVEFERDSSPNCHELAKKSWSRLDIADATSDYVPVMVDIDAHPELARQYDIATVPSLVVIDAKTQSIIRDGRDITFAPDELLIWLKPDSKPAWKISNPQDMLDSQKSLFDTPKSSFSP